MNKNDLFAYVLQDTLVRCVLPDWPVGLSLAVCLRADGSCKMVVGHSGQDARLLIRVAVMHDRPAGSFPVAPEAFGWPTRKVRFSEEQDILRLVADAEGLVDTAEKFARAHAAEAAEPPKPTAEPRAKTPAAPAKPRLNLGPALRKPAPPAPAPVSAPAPAGLPRMPQGFAPADATGRRDCLFASGHIGRHGDAVRIALNPDQITIHTRPERATEVGFSVDFRQFHLPREVLRNWRPGQPAVIDIPPTAFPAGLCERLASCRFRIEATVTSEGLFLTQGAEIVEMPDMPAMAAVAPRWSLSFRHVAALALFLFGSAAATYILLGEERPMDMAMLELALSD